jgi:hypothetical protein
MARSVLGLSALARALAGINQVGGVHLNLYIVGLVCGTLYGLTIVLGESWPVFGLACCGSVVVAIVIDPDIYERDE